MIQEFGFPGPPDLVRGQASQGMTEVASQGMTVFIGHLTSSIWTSSERSP